jgi:ABC-type transport system involved in multi-copper enzyme maturation permease subunit
MGVSLFAQSAAPTAGFVWGVTAGAIAAFWAAIIVFSFTTRAGIVARATTKEAVRQPVFFLMLFIAAAILVLNTFIPFFSLGEDVKMLKDCGLATILISCLLLAVWTASTGISAEIEGKTTMTLLSKPLNRRQFIIGKYVGILQAVLMLLVPLSLVFLSLIYYKVGYDAREASQEVPEMFNWVSVSWLPFELPTPVDRRWFSTTLILPGLLLIFFEAAILTAISVAIATRAPMVVNIVTCLAVYIVGHLAPVLVHVSTENQVLENVQFVARLIATILPSLAMFDTQASVATDVLVPPEYLMWSAIYCVAYVAAAILAAFMLFEDRDLA